MTPDTPMLERIARALHDHEWRGQPRPEPFHVQKEYWMGYARAAVEAMREPTGAMSFAGETASEDAHDEGRDTNGSYACWNDIRVANECYRAMIDAILNEGSHD